MKVRHGFVSNSSTTSFLIYGAQIPTDKEEEAKLLGLSTYSGDCYSDDEFFAGLSWDCVGDDETGKQFKERVEALIKQIDAEAKCGTIDRAYRDG